MAIAAARAVEHVGLPECTYALAQAAIYLSLAPKSNAAGRALGAARAHIREHGAALPPGAAALGRLPGGGASSAAGIGYDYPHDHPGQRQRPGAPARRARGRALLRPGRGASRPMRGARSRGIRNAPRGRARVTLESRSPRRARCSARSPPRPSRTSPPRRARDGRAAAVVARAGGARARATSAAPRWRCSTSSTSSRCCSPRETGWPRTRGRARRAAAGRRAGCARSPTTGRARSPTGGSAAPALLRGGRRASASSARAA